VARSFPGRRTSLLTSADRLTLASAVVTPWNFQFQDVNRKNN
jgi:hypothetical protein